MQYQSYIDSGKMDKTKALGDNFQRDLKEMVNGLQTNIPNVGIYIWCCGEDADTHNTQHTIISANVFDKTILSSTIKHIMRSASRFR